MSTQNMTLDQLAEALVRESYSSTEVARNEDSIDVMERANSLFIRVRFDDTSVTLSKLDRYHVVYAEVRLNGTMTAGHIARFAIDLLN